MGDRAPKAVRAARAGTVRLSGRGKAGTVKMGPKGKKLATTLAAAKKGKAKKPKSSKITRKTLPKIRARRK